MLGEHHQKEPVGRFYRKHCSSTKWHKYLLRWWTELPFFFLWCIWDISFLFSFPFFLLSPFLFIFLFPFPFPFSLSFPFSFPFLFLSPFLFLFLFLFPFPFCLSFPFSLFLYFSFYFPFPFPFLFSFLLFPFFSFPFSFSLWIFPAIWRKNQTPKQENNFLTWVTKLAIQENS